MRVVRPVVPQLHELARVLRTDDASVRGVALTEQLMTSDASVLYRAACELLRRDLGRASSGLEFIDPTGLHLLTRLEERCTRDGIRLDIVRGILAVQKLFRITGTGVQFRFTEWP